MKKKVFIASVFLLCLAILAGTTMAYFTASDTAHNVITSGNVDIQLVEQQDRNGTLVDYPDVPITGIMPGESVSKIVSVRNIGSGDAWVRIQVDKRMELNPAHAGNEETADPELMVLDINTDRWTEKDGWYYYKEPLPVGKSSEPLFRTVGFSMDMDNAYQEADMDIVVHAQAVQSKNNPLPVGGDFSKIPGWPEK